MPRGTWMKPTDTRRKQDMAKTGDYPHLLSEIKERIRSAQYEALKAVNKELVGLYYRPTDRGAAGGRRTRRVHSRPAIPGSAIRVPRHQRVFPAQRLLHAGILPALPR